jgi:nucleobase:cation symporter-1, NCS1 family
MTSTSSPVTNQALTPLLASSRVFGWAEHASLWFSLGVGLLVMQIGAYLASAVGTRYALLAIAGGSFIGAGLLAWVAKVGADSGLASAGLIHATYGSYFARLPIVLNIVQLVGWTTFELVIMREGTLAIIHQTFGLDRGSIMGLVLTTLLWGAILTALAAGSMIILVRRFVTRFGLPLVVLSLVWFSWQFLSQLDATGLDAIWRRPGNGSMGLFSALDLVIAMPVSWLPLVADYARHGHTGRSALSGTWTGYAVANIWCYSLGVLAVSVGEPSADLVGALLLAQGGLIALGFILIDEIDNAYGDIYSGAVSAHSFKPRWGIRCWALIIAVSSTALALVLPMHGLQPFLLMLSSVFVPLYGVILGRIGLTHCKLLPGARKIDVGAAGLWVLGIIIYHGLAQWAPQLGSALPTLAITFVLAAVSGSKSQPAGVV